MNMNHLGAVVFNLQFREAIRRTVLLVIAILLISIVNRQALAQTPVDLSANYDKTQLMITMRDGIKLFTTIYSPKDHSQKYPILMLRTPYSSAPYELTEFPPVSPPLERAFAPSADFVRAGYIFVFQDARGTYHSEGTWDNLKPIRTDPKATDESTDAYDTIDWLVKNVPNNNGRVGQWGISHPGWYTVMGLVEPHPALKAASPQATTFDPFKGDDRHRNGAYIPLTIDWVHRMSSISGPDREKYVATPYKDIDYGTPWNYEFFLNAGPVSKINESHYGGELALIWQDVDHPTYDAYWKSLNVRRSLVNIHTPVLNVMGWFDSQDPYGTMATFHTIKESSPLNDTSLVIGPWSHAGWLKTDGSRLGDIDFGSGTSAYYQKNIVFPFFEYYLKDKGGWSPNQIFAFETGNNQWHQPSQWPPKGVVSENLYLAEHGTLSFAKPSGSKTLSDSYISDPFHPVPYTSEIRADRGIEHMTEDQRYASTRPDVLAYQTDVLKSDVTIAGPIPVHIVCSTTGTDSDWIVKLIDVYPDNAPDNPKASHDVKMGGYQMLLGFQVMRGKFRDSLSQPQPMVPGKPTSINLVIDDKYHTFKVGHRIMVQIQSSYFPYFDRNPQTFTNIYKADDSVYRVATQKVYHSTAMSSYVALPVLK